jgi:phosphonoacetaldehyde hydrolase
MIRLVIFDWAGTLIDFGSLAPLEAYREVFAQQGVEVSSAEIRGPMGMHKRDHLQAVLKLPEVSARWKKARGQSWNETDIDRMYHEFMPIQLRKIKEFDRLIPGVLECVRELRNKGIKIGTSTGYFREATNWVLAAAREQGFSPDCTICADDVPNGRPAPWMVFRAMEQLGVYPPSAVVKVGDTVADIQEGVNAGVWSVGVTTSGSEVGYSQSNWNELSAAQMSELRASARRKLQAANAYAVIDSMAELPALVDTMLENWRRT